MRKVSILSLLILMLIIYNFFNLRSKNHKISSEIVNKDFIVSYYKVYNFGVWGGDKGNAYIQNLKKNEIFIGTFDDDTYYDFLAKSNHIEVTKFKKIFRKKIIIYKRNINLDFDKESSILNEFYYTIIK